MENEIKEYLKHFGKELITKEIEEYATEVALKDSRYMFIERRGKERYTQDPLTEERIRLGKQQYGYCTYCNKEYETDGLKHNEETTCPGCNSEVKVKSSGISRKYLWDDAYFIHYEKSKIDKDIVVAKGVFAQRDYKGDYKNITTRYNVTALYIFKINEPIMIGKGYNWGKYGYGWTKRKKMFLENYAPRVSILTNLNSLESAIKDTSYQYSMYKDYMSEWYQTQSIIEYLELFSKYPRIEDLTKLGFENIVRDKLYERATYRAVNWNGKTVFKMLRVNRAELKELRSYDGAITPCFMRLYQLNKKENTKLTLNQLKELERITQYNFEDFRKILKYTSLYKASKYISIQEERYLKKFYRGGLVIRDWRDYIKDCIELKMDIKKERVLFPKDLYKSHQNTIKQVKYQADKLLDEKMKKREEEINKKYYFEDKNYIIRAAKSTQEMIDEGKILIHCVGGYASKHAKGETNILFIREKKNADKPYYTMEIKNNRIVQVRGFENEDPGKKLNKFIDKFRALKIEKVKNKKIA